MKNNLKLILLISILTLLLSCSKDLFPGGLTLGDFENHLKSSMSYTEIVDKFGQPSNDIGSGIHIYVYLLTDSTEIWIGYADKILYAKQMDSNQQLIKTLI
jgi:hypothetical protein